MKVQNMTSNNGNKIANQFIIEDDFRIQINDDKKRRLYRDIPFGQNWGNAINLAVGSLFGDSDKEIMFTSSGGGKIVVVNYYGMIMNYGFYPFGSKDSTGFSLAIGNVDGGKRSESIHGFVKNNKAEVLIYNFRYDTLLKRFTVGYNNNETFVASGDTDGDGIDEIITALVYNDKTIVKTFNINGAKLAEFTVATGFGGKTIGVGALDANFDGKDNIVLMSK